MTRSNRRVCDEWSKIGRFLGKKCPNCGYPLDIVDDGYSCPVCGYFSSENIQEDA
ncbi:MAG: hypothetical protein ACTSVU_10155 [Promethearchaeota archaeon]